ncbi:hypothetical protein P7C73_g1485, partial [Tremellales sp. Uapishka_1]
MDLAAKGTIAKQPDAWVGLFYLVFSAAHHSFATQENASAHPSQFLTTKDGKPRLFPFPLGKAGAEDSLKGNLWWEAGNSAHVGHFNQRETPEAREALRLEMEAKEELRVSKAKKALKSAEATRKKWTQRMTRLKVLSGIVIMGLCELCTGKSFTASDVDSVHRPAAVICLAAMIYYELATAINGMLKVKQEDKPPRPLRRKPVPQTPGMGMTYIYETTADGGVAEAASIPVKAPTHRLMTSTDSRYAS